MKQRFTYPPKVGVLKPYKEEHLFLIRLLRNVDTSSIPVFIDEIASISIHLQEENGFVYVSTPLLRSGDLQIEPKEYTTPTVFTISIKGLSHYL